MENMDGKSKHDELLDVIKSRLPHLGPDIDELRRCLRKPKQCYPRERCARDEDQNKTR